VKRRHQARIANQTDQSDDYFAFLPSDTITTTILGASSFVIVDDDVNNMPTFSLSLGADSSSFVQVTQAVPNSLIKRGGRMQQQQQQTNFLSSSSSNEPSRSMMKNVYCGKVRLVGLRPASLKSLHGTLNMEQLMVNKDQTVVLQIRKNKGSWQLSVEVSGSCIVLTSGV